MEITTTDPDTTHKSQKITHNTTYYVIVYISYSQKLTQLILSHPSPQMGLTRKEEIRRKTEMSNNGA